jgi:hypothetical protein
MVDCGTQNIGKLFSSCPGSVAQFAYPKSKFWHILQGLGMKTFSTFTTFRLMFDVLFSHLVYFVVVWYILSHFGMFWEENLTTLSRIFNWNPKVLGMPRIRLMTSICTLPTYLDCVHIGNWAKTCIFPCLNVQLCTPIKQTKNPYVKLSDHVCRLAFNCLRTKPQVAKYIFSAGSHGYFLHVPTYICKK